MLKQTLGALLCTIICSAAFADGIADSTSSTSLSVTGPQEVGTTSMPPGNYLIKEQTTGKSFSLMVSNKGTMILAPAPSAAATAAAPAAAVTTTGSPTNALTGLGSNAIKKMMQDQVTKGVTNVIQKDATNSFTKFMK
ncbi:hypothetical protein BH10CYA1_BH10CYA1_45760 [soil metagenome]